MPLYEFHETYTRSVCYVIEAQSFEEAEAAFRAKDVASMLSVSERARTTVVDAHHVGGPDDALTS